jgi:hypothetical protein
MRKKIIERAKHYYGIPYSRKYHGPDSKFYNYHQYLDCCGLVRQVMRDFQDDLGFTLGPWNQAYQFDMLPKSIPLEEMKPGDLVFLKGIYFPEKKLRPQKHDIVHVEIYVGGEDEKQKKATIAARWGKGVVKMFDSFEFVSKNYHSIQYIFKSIDPWLDGICESNCEEHDWNFIVGKDKNEINLKGKTSKITKIRFLQFSKFLTMQKWKRLILLCTYTHQNQSHLY